MDRPVSVFRVFRVRDASIEDKKKESLGSLGSYRSINRIDRSIVSIDQPIDDRQTDRQTNGRTDPIHRSTRLDSTPSIDRLDSTRCIDRRRPTTTDDDRRTGSNGTRRMRVVVVVVVASRRRARKREGGAMTVVKRTNRCATVAFGCDAIDAREDDGRPTRMRTHLDWDRLSTRARNEMKCARDVGRR